MSWFKSFISGLGSAIGAVGGAAGSFANGNFGGAISSLGSLFSSNASSQNKFNDRVLAANQAENEAQRKFQREMADLSYSRQKELMNLINAYNDPSAMRSRMVNAGFNPNLIYGMNMAGSEIGSPSSGSTSGSSPASGMMAATPLNDELSRAQIGLIDAQASQARAVAKKTNAEANWVDILSQSSFDLNGVQIRQSESTIGINDEQKKVLGKTLDRMSLEMEDIACNIEFKTSQQLLNELELRLRSATFQTEIDKAAAELQLTKNEAYAVVEGLSIQAALAASNIKLNSAAAAEHSAGAELKLSQSATEKVRKCNETLANRGLVLDLESKKIDIDVKKEMKDFNKYCDGAERVLGVAFDVINVKNLITGRKSTTTRTDSDGNSSTSTTHTR